MHPQKQQEAATALANERGFALPDIEGAAANMQRKRILKSSEDFVIRALEVWKQSRATVGCD